MVLRDPIGEQCAPPADLVDLLRWTLQNIETYFRGINRQRWIPRPKAMELVQACHDFTEGISTLRHWCKPRGWKLYTKTPKLHHQQEIGLWMVDQLARGTLMVMSPRTFATWRDEDYIGRVARMSRRCHSWTICIGTMRRALMHYKRKWHKEGWLKEGRDFKRTKR